MAGFKLRKRSSNVPVVIEDIPNEDRLHTWELNKDNVPKTKTLGVLWEAKRDVFTFQVQLPLVDNKPLTKRNVLSAIASLFDPLQFLAPFTVRAKVLMQMWTADLPTRGLSAVALAKSEVSMEGPAFLKNDESTWPAGPPP